MVEIKRAHKKFGKGWPCEAAQRAISWLLEQPTWTRLHGADHIYFGTNSGRPAFTNFISRHPPFAEFYANAIGVSIEDRLQQPTPRAVSLRTLTVPHKINQKVYYDHHKRRENIAVFFGGISGFNCHLQLCYENETYATLYNSVVHRVREVSAEAASRSCSNCSVAVTKHKGQSLNMVDAWSLYCSATFCLCQWGTSIPGERSTKRSRVGVFQFSRNL